MNYDFFFFFLMLQPGAQPPRMLFAPDLTRTLRARMSQATAKAQVGSKISSTGEQARALQEKELHT